MNPREALVALNLIRDIGPTTVRRLLDVFGDAPTILRAPERELGGVEGIGPARARAIARWEQSVDLQGELGRVRDFGAQVITVLDSGYPLLLKQIHDPPIVLYVIGQLAAEDDHAVAMVGTRMVTQYGRAAAHQLAGQLARAGLTIISGGARGVDTASHEGALSVGGRTIVILGTGLDIVYPSENADLFKRISSHGAVITQFPFGRRGDKQSFPIRNRIVAGMARATVVVEANRASGALITANFAAEYGRAVFAIPGRIDNPRSTGCHDLIRDGAQLCAGPEHVLEEFDTLFASNQIEKKPLPQLTSDEKAVYGKLTHDEQPLDAIVHQTGLTVPKVTVALLQLELKHLAKQFPGRLFAKKR
ncbi:MAG: DNA-protecting protein DprA [Verrucomicrobiales bacterium]|nr:DNA-protecting protein DprA [Verrucomicrobiales bacterium]